MRIFIGSPPKTGNTWVKNLLSQSYGLKILNREPRTVAAFAEQVEGGWFEDDSVFHQHFGPDKKLYSVINALNCHMVSTLRNPYDVFVSFYFYLQNFPEKFGVDGHPLAHLVGKPIDDPLVLDFLKNKDTGFGHHIVVAHRWVKSNRSIVVRYEEMHADPVRTLTAVTDKIQPVEKKKIIKAVDICSADKMRKRTPSNLRFIRRASVGNWMTYLTVPHFEIMREYAGLINELGYDVL